MIKYLLKLVRENRSRKNRWGLKITLTEKAESKKAKKLEEGSKQSALDLIEAISKVESLEDLKEFRKLSLPDFLKKKLRLQ